ncbi:MAG TPA: CaiB/BaiF CoA-transferase family protein [Bordetella sp.]|nr:CaiB/BaiF CoA-transferase family protein [Bordetella sp.]
MDKLHGIRVIDMSRVLAGPLAGQMLADLGAEVIKIEQPGTGDEARHYGPPFLGEEGEGGTAFFLAANRNKRSVTVDFSTPEGSRIVRQLAGKSDVVIENFRVGTLARYGLDYATLSAQNPGLVYCSLTGFGQSGPYARRPGYDAIFQSMGGLMSSIGYPDDHPAGGPLRTGLSITDVITSLYADVAIVAAVHARAHNGGRGDYIDVALLDSTVAAMSHYAMYYLISGQMLPRRGNYGNGGVPSQVFQCRDGSIMLTVGNDAQFIRFCQALGCPEWADDSRFSTGVGRIRNRDALVPILEAHFATRSVAKCLDALVAADIPAGAINNIEQVFADSQVVSRHLRIPVQEDAGTPLDVIANPIRYAHDPIGAYRRPPLLGEHTDEVLGDLLGYTQEELGRLADTGVIGRCRHQ